MSKTLRQRRELAHWRNPAWQYDKAEMHGSVLPFLQRQIARGLKPREPIDQPNGRKDK